MKKISIISFVLVICLMLMVFLPKNQIILFATETDFQTSAKAMCVIEKDSGRVVASKNMDQKLAMASTTKILTALTVIENCKDLDVKIEIPKQAVGVEGSSIYVRDGELMSVKDLLYGLMLRSGNDSAVALAYHVGNNLEGFAKLMNETAKQAGATNSNFVTPHGLDHKDHYTTAYDLALITAKALNNPIFKEIVSTKTYIAPATNKSDIRYMNNKNRLLNNLEGCVGVKTGYTKKAGRCLVSAIERNETTYICVVLNCGPMFEESEKLLNTADCLYKNTKIVDKNKEIYNEYIIDKQEGKLYLYAEKDFSYPLLQSELKDIEIKYSVELSGAAENDCVGEIKVFFKKDLLKTIKLFTMNKINKLIDSKTLNIKEVLWADDVA